MQLVDNCRVMELDRATRVTFCDGFGIINLGSQRSGLRELRKPPWYKPMRL